MSDFRIVRDLQVSLFKECAVWSEYYDYDELEEIRSWGVKEKYIDELVAIANEGGAHPYYPIYNKELLPDRMRIFISAQFVSPNSKKFEGVICNPDPFVIGIFLGNEIVKFNPNLEDFWQQSESKLRSFYRISSDPILPLTYSTRFKDGNGKEINGVFNHKSNA